ncbi:MAG: APC family permease [Thermoproteus sp.]
MESSYETRRVLRREIGLLDLVFLSFGGQSPFLSILSYGVLVLTSVGAIAPVAILLGTLMVLVNGLVVYRLSTRFTQAGGYYTYAYYSLTKRLGFETGWLYTIYAVLYGSAYVIAAASVLVNVVGLPPLLVLTSIFAVSSIFLILGIKPTARYAMVASMVEAAAMAAVAFLFLSSTGWRFYNPLATAVAPSSLAAAAILGAGIPTGYGSITPVSGEVKNPRRNVPLAIIAVILMGGGLAALDVYAIADHFIYLGGASGSVLDLIALRFGLLTLSFVLFAAVNDGVLATLAFMIAASRTLYAMSFHGLIPRKLSEVKGRSGPLYASLVTIALYALTLYSSYISLGLSAAFAALALISMLANSIVHVSANFSLLRIALKRIRKRAPELALSVAATALTTYLLLQSLGGIPLPIVTGFMALLVLGFLVAEIREMIVGEEEEE